MTDTSTLTLPSDTLPSDQLIVREQRCIARWHCRRTTSSVTIVSAHGAIDGTNAVALTEYALGQAAGCRGLILDLRDLEFFGTEGFSALHRVSVGCAHDDIDWVVIPGAAVSRLLRICDPGGALPAAGSVGVARGILAGRPVRPLTLVGESVRSR